MAVLGSRAATAQQVTTGLDVTDIGAAGLDAGTSPSVMPWSGLDAPGVERTVSPAISDRSDAQGPALRPTFNPQAEEPTLYRTRVGPPPLPPLQHYPTTPLPSDAKPHGAAVDTNAPSLANPPVIGPTVATIPAPLPRHLKPDPAPFAPLGFTIGTFRFTPYIDQSLGYDTNPDQVSVGVKPSAFSRTEGGFDLLSLWSSNQLKATMHGAYTDFFSNPQADRPDAAGTIDYRYDVTRDFGLDAEGRFVVATQRPGSPELNVNVRDRPLVSSYGTSLGGTDTLGRFTFGLHGSFDRTEYENGVLPDGTVVPLADQTFNDYGITGRVDYEASPVLKPFLELTGDTRIHDQEIDDAGYARNSDGFAARLGSAFELTSLITGTVSAGYEDRTYRDKRLRDLRGPLFDAALAYAVTPLTTLTLTAGTTFNETNVIGSPGTESRSVALQVSHALLRNLTVTGTVAYLNSDYVGSSIVENTISGTLKASYSLSRSVVLEASYNHQTLTSTASLSNFAQDVVLVGVRIQH